MTVSFTLGNPSFKDCGICLSAPDNEFVSHNWVDEHGKLNGHAFHKECIKEWVKITALCPFCKAPVEKSSLFSWKERCIKFLKEKIIAVKESAVFNEETLLNLYISTLQMALAAGLTGYAAEDVTQGRIGVLGGIACGIAGSAFTTSLAATISNASTSRGALLGLATGIVAAAAGGGSVEGGALFGVIAASIGARYSGLGFPFTALMSIGPGLVLSKAILSFSNKADLITSSGFGLGTAILTAAIEGIAFEALSLPFKLWC